MNSVNALLENTIVETYHISEVKDTLEVFNEKLEEGTITYCFLLGLEEGFILELLFRDAEHSIGIKSKSVKRNC